MNKLTPNEVGQGYDAFTDLYDQLWGINMHHGYWEGASDDVSFEVAGNRLTDKLAGMLTVEPGDRLLDIGCGSGAPAIRLASEHHIDVVGISVSGRQIELANERAASAGLSDRLSFEYADAMNLPFPAESFDLVWALESLHHMPDRWHVISQAAKVLRPGGRIAIGDFLKVPGGEDNGDADRVEMVRDGVLEIVELDEYLSKIRAAGLEPVAAEDVSAHTRPSWAKSVEMFEQAREVAVRTIGAEQFEMIQSRFRQFSEAPTVGYVLLTARKPV